MSDWTGGGTTIVTPPSTAPDCLEYLTVDEVREEYSSEVEGLSDASIQRRIDRLASALEYTLGHTFGRALIARSRASDPVEVTATALVIGGDTYLFADYPTLYELVSAANAAGGSYGLELLPQIVGTTPSTLLKIHANALCGPLYADRVPLCLSAMYFLTSGKRETHVFLPLRMAEVLTVTQDGVALATTDYWAVVNESWLIRRGCGCTNTGGCPHPRRYWSAATPNNIAVTFVPVLWATPYVPAVIANHMLEAFAALAGIAPLAQEDFGDYSYKRGTAAVDNWSATIGSGALRGFATIYHP